MENSRLSIIIPYYDPEAKISHKLTQLLYELARQQGDYPETEIILVADGCKIVLDGWCKLPYMETIMLPGNRGASHARNVGLHKSSGEFISFIDADDGIEPDYLDTIYKTMRCGYDYALFRFIYESNGAICNNRDELYGNYALWAWCFNRRIIGAEMFNENLNVNEDIDWLSRVVKDGMFGYRSEKAIYRYDWDANPDSLCKRFNRGEIKREREL